MAKTGENYKKLPIVDSNEAPPPPYAVQVVQPGARKSPLTDKRGEPRMDRINLAIFAMICCFWPLGLVALFKAIRGMQAVYKGDTTTATTLNKSSTRWSIASIVVGVLLVVFFCFLGFLANTIPRILVAVLNKNGTESYDYDKYHGHDGHMG